MKKKLQNQIEITEKTTFRFLYEDNARNTVIALSFAGYYVRARRDDGNFVVEVYTDREV